MKIIGDYHTHTYYSHGKGSIEENVQSALEKGLKYIAITDHGPSYEKYGIDPSDYFKMREIVNHLNEKYLGKIKVLLGIEANILDQKGTLDVEDKILKDLDILLAGFHFDIVYKKSLNHVRSRMKRHENLKFRIDPIWYEEIKEIHTKAMIEAIKKYPINMITHPSDQQPIDILKLCHAIQNQPVLLEINNFHRHLSVGNMREAMKIKNINFVMSSDAHRPKDVGTFIGAMKRIKKAGLELDRIQNLIQ